MKKRLEIPLSREELWERFYIDDERNLRNRISTNPNMKVGAIAGRVTNNGYRLVKLKGKLFYVHRIVYFMHTGEQPDILDHINGNGLDNRIENLRPVTNAQNLRNRKSHKGSSSQFLGVCWVSKDKRWMARIHVGDKQQYLGRFHDEVEAAKAYDAAAIKHFGEFANPNFPRD